MEQLDGTTIGNDFYYGINSCEYRKSDSGRVVVFTDRYDYEFKIREYVAVAGIANNAMWTLQSLGYLTPYYSIIEQNISKTLVQPSAETIYTMGNYDRFISKEITLGSGEYKDYYISFSTAGTKNMQTFGYNDAYLELYNSSGVMLTYNDDAGYSLNSLISYYFNANTTYKLRVRFWSSSKSGDVRLVITPSSYSNYDTITEIGFSGWWIFGSTTATVNSNANYINMLRYYPTSTASYTIKTTKNGSSYVDTYLYLVDPRLPISYTENPYKPYAQNDDAAGNLQASISKKLTYNIPYLIVAAKFNVSTQGMFNVEIS